jgi:hypothetical protein
MTADHGALERARAQLAPERTGVAAAPARPDPPCEELGAVAGFGLVTVERGIRVSVYLFEHWGGGQQLVGATKAAAEAVGDEAVIGVSGPLLFLGVHAGGDEDAHYLVNDLCSAFSGHE